MWSGAGGSRGVIVAWVSLDDDDTPNLFGSYLAYAFEHAGLDPDLLSAHDAWVSSPAVQQMGMLARAIERHEGACLLVLDEVDRLPRRTVQLIHLLLRRAPRNLHVALTFRLNPGLELATHLLDGGAVVGADTLRFSTADIERFFDRTLSEEELAGVEECTAGWPVALTIYRDGRAGKGRLLDADAVAITENYISMGLLSDLSKQDRVCLLDLAVFDWIDAELVDDVLRSSAARLRIVSSSSLNGLLLPVGPDGTVRRLHPLLRGPLPSRALGRGPGSQAFSAQADCPGALSPGPTDGIVARCRRAGQQPAGRRSQSRVTADAGSGCGRG